jgi:adenosylmethionine-8-amino-7-oxononanoate aminotransferase
MVCDEVMCGMGRCSDGQSLHAWRSINPDLLEREIAPDIQTAGKGLGGGYIPIAAVMVSKKVADVLASGTGTFVNGFTYQAHPTGCAAALAVQTVIKDDNLLERSAELGRQLEHQLKDKVAPLPHVGDVRGAGLFWGVEFVKDKNSKSAFGKTGAAATVADAAFVRGVQVYVCEGVCDGVIGDAIIFAPAYNCTAAEIAMMVDVVAESIKETFS